MHLEDNLENPPGDFNKDLYSNKDPLENREEQPKPPEDTPQSLDFSKVEHLAKRVKEELHKVIIGQDEMIDQLIVSLLCGGHVLIEGVPGIAKTLTAKLLAQTLALEFCRIQFTPDLMPSDVIGTTIFNMKTSEFSFSPGPVFSNVILIDEINRAPAKTQAALFEVMEESQVTVDGVTYHMDYPFFVMATQNPIEQEGTYKLPEAQLDRFLMKINMDYPSLKEEREILFRFRNDFNLIQRLEVQTLFGAKEVKECRDIIEQIVIKDQLLNYVADIVHSTRNHGDLFLGASPRASLAILKTAKATAAMEGRDFVIPEDIKTVAYPVLNHRVILTPERDMEGVDVKDVISDIIKKIEVPR